VKTILNKKFKVYERTGYGYVIEFHSPNPKFNLYCYSGDTLISFIKQFEKSELSNHLFFKQIKGPKEYRYLRSFKEIQRLVKLSQI
jgi:hypothetical protein